MKRTIACLIGGVVIASGLGAIAKTPPQESSPRPLASAAPTALPEGEGRDVAQRVCGQCHSVGLFAAQRHTQDEWNQVISRMMAKGMDAPEDDLYEISDYLAQALGKDTVDDAGAGATP
jgi:cytochrome c5